MKLEDYKAPVPAGLKELAKDWHVERCYVFTPEEWEQVLELRRTEWRGKWGMQW